MIIDKGISYETIDTVPTVIAMAIGVMSAALPCFI